MSGDKRLNRTQEVDGSSPFSSTNPLNHLVEIWARKQECACLVSIWRADRHLAATLHRHVPRPDGIDFRKPGAGLLGKPQRARS